MKTQSITEKLRNMLWWGRLQKLLRSCEHAGQDGRYSAYILKKSIEAAEKALASRDDVAIRRAYDDLRRY